MDLSSDAIHVVSGGSAAGALTLAGLSVRGDPDMLACGPCDLNEVRHARLRQAFWKSEYKVAGWRWRRGPTAARWPTTGRLAIWSSPWIPDRLFLWHAVHRLAHRDIELWHVEAHNPEFPVEGVGALPRDLIPSCLRTAKRIQGRALTTFRHSWRAFVAGDLDHVMRSLDPSLRSTLRTFLPRHSRTGLRLSVHDERLLAGFESWNRPIDALKSKLPELLVFGDLLVLTRLVRWTRGPEPALEARQPSKTVSWRSPELRLTPAGRRKLQELRSPGEAPSFVIGGHQLYSPHTYATTPAHQVVRV
jgi:hypothetical protein